MPESLRSDETLQVFAQAAAAALNPDPAVRPFPSPADWRDHPIYFLLIDRFNNPDRAPQVAWNQPFGQFQGGTFNGVRDQLSYIKEVGFGAIWISPIQKNLQWEGFTYHGYGIHDFLAIEPRFTSDITRARTDPAFAESEFRSLVDAAHEQGLYVILDVVINHVGNVFGYDPGPADGQNSERAFKGFGGDPYTIFWRDENGVGQAGATTLPANPSREAVVWPRELQVDGFYRRRGVQEDSHPREGDFSSLKELVTEFQNRDNGRFPVRDFLIRAHQYMIGRYDVDGFRIDTLKHVEPDFARVFGNAIREYALSIGKHNFFTFGEVADENETTLAEFIGRDTQNTQTGEAIGVDAALDFPLRAFLTPFAKAQGRLPGDLVTLYANRKEAQRTRLTTHGEASQYFVTFLDNHDNKNFRFTPFDAAGATQFDPQFALGYGCLMALQGIPCVYYGSEQGLTGLGDGTGDAGVREALWGKPNPFDRTFKFYQVFQRLLQLRAREPALRYGRQYFRPVSGDNNTFSVSSFPNGVLAFSRVLNDREVVVVANPNTQDSVDVFVIVDDALNPQGDAYRVLYSNQANPTAPGAVDLRQGGQIVVFEADGDVNRGGPLKSVRVQLQPMEIQIVGL